VREEERERLLEEAEAGRRQGRLDLARSRCEAILRHDARDGRALGLMAEIAADARQAAQGLEWAERALAADPGSATPHYAMGRLFELEDRLADAEASYRRAIALAPDLAKAHNNLGCVLHMQGRLDEALASYRAALELDPQQPEANQNYASIARDPAALEQAIEGYRRQIARNPNDAIAFNNLANACREKGRVQEALEHFARAVEIDPDYAEAHFGRSHVLLLCGEYAEGWKEHEWRLRVPPFDAPARRFGQLMWDGSRLPAGTVLLHAEQGLGDTLQFVRYAPLVAERCAAVVLECQPALKTLLSSVKGIRRILAQGEALPPFDAHLPLMSLPAVFGTSLETIPWQGPYVHPEAASVADWRRKIASDPARLKVGIAWAGRSENWDDRKRSIPLTMLAPLAQAPGVTFYSLQKGDAAAQAASPPEGMRLLDIAAQSTNFSDAGLICQLDLVITVDTSVAHLAGAMGIPTWVLVAHSPDWRYHLGRDDNPWYPSMRLFRQPSDGDWADPIRRAAHELLRRAESLHRSST
jgi:tetratricopeptide (TPR) repeat protein